MRYPRYVFLDVEARGLHGEGFAVGYVFTDETGFTMKEGLHCAPYTTAQHMEGIADSYKRSNDAWLDKHVAPVLPFPDSQTPRAVRQKFITAVHAMHDLAEENGKSLIWVADCGFPCETRFLAQCYTDNPFDQILLPYPLLDLATLLDAEGYDPKGTYYRNPSETPAHNPLHDARQTARIWFQLKRGEPVE